MSCESELYKGPPFVEWGDEAIQNYIAVFFFGAV